MHSQGNLPAYVSGMDPTPYYMAAIEAMDYQMGRLLESIPTEERENTVIIFIGDNGTPNQVVQAPYSANTAKGTLFQGGINVPMFVAGKGVSRIGTDDNLITDTDLFATIAEIAGSSANEIHDSKSFQSLFTSNQNARRSYQYSEMNDGTIDAWAIGNGAYKLVVNANGDEQMYNLAADAYERNNLLDGNLNSTETNAKLELEAELLNIRN